jgi:hypothetical protein
MGTDMADVFWLDGLWARVVTVGGRVRGRKSYREKILDAAAELVSEIGLLRNAAYNR